MEGPDFVSALIVANLAFVLWLLSTALLIWGERRVVAKMQTRVGPNRLGPMGIVQTLADGIKLFFKEDLTPKIADRAVFIAAPVISATTALVMFAVIPFGGTVELFGREVTLQVWDPEIGLLWVFAMSSLGVYGIVLAGWASGSKYPLLGGVRSSAQMVSYELGMALAFAAVFVWNGTLQVSEIVEAQSGTLAELGPITIPAWNVLPQVFAFAIFFLTAVAETQRPPFDLPEGEGEIVGGFHTEYSGAKFAMFYLGEFMNMFTFSAVMVTLFFGGPGGPLFGPDWLQAILPTLYFMAKTAGFLFIFIWLRGTLPRFRYDRLMDLGWKVLLPFGLVWVMLTGVIVVGQDELQALGMGQLLTLFGVVGVVALVLLILPSLRREQAEEEPAVPASQRVQRVEARELVGATPSRRPAEPPDDVGGDDPDDRER